MYLLNLPFSHITDNFMLPKALPALKSESFANVLLLGKWMEDPHCSACSYRRVFSFSLVVEKK